MLGLMPHHPPRHQRMHADGILVEAPRHLGVNDLVRHVRSAPTEAASMGRDQAFPGAVVCAGREVGLPLCHCCCSVASTPSVPSRSASGWLPTATARDWQRGNRLSPPTMTWASTWSRVRVGVHPYLVEAHAPAAKGIIHMANRHFSDRVELVVRLAKP